MLTTLNIMIEFPAYCDKLVKFPSYRQLIYGQHPAKHQELSTLNPKIHSLVTADPLYKMSSSEKGYVWTNRQILVGFPKALPKLLQCVNWKETKMGLEALRFDLTLSLHSPIPLNILFPSPFDLSLSLLLYFRHHHPYFSSFTSTITSDINITMRII